MQPEYQHDYEDDELETDEDDSLPPAVTLDRINDINHLSPSELEILIEDIDANEEWESLRDTAKERAAQWLMALEHADEAPRCAHVKTSGKPCGSPAVKDDTFCYFHGQTRAKREAEQTAKTLDMPLLEDKLSVQLAIMRVCGLVAAGSIQERAGSVIISGLRLAQKNL
jgi:hypothetical protein